MELETELNRLFLMYLNTHSVFLISHLLIMDQREALDGTIIIRSTRNSSQNIISVQEVPKFLRTLR
jgi:histidyl-tRNA synthetase